MKKVTVIILSLAVALLLIAVGVTLLCLTLKNKAKASQTANPCVHEYESELFSPTCQKNGYTRFTCSVCGDLYVSDFLPKTEHTQGEVEEVLPTCLLGGYREQSLCLVCGEVLSERESYPPLSHDLKTELLQNATCLKVGLSVSSCNRCDYKEETILPKLPHEEKECSRQDPVCGKAGKVVFVCGVCGEEREELLAAFEHEYKEAERLVPETGMIEGFRYCTKCDHTELLYAREAD